MKLIKNTNFISYTYSTIIKQCPNGVIRFEAFEQQIKNNNHPTITNHLEYQKYRAQNRDGLPNFYQTQKEAQYIKSIHNKGRFMIDKDQIEVIPAKKRDDKILVITEQQFQKLTWRQFLSASIRGKQKQHVFMKYLLLTMALTAINLFVRIFRDRRNHQAQVLLAPQRIYTYPLSDTKNIMKYNKKKVQAAVSNYRKMLESLRE